MGTLRRNKAICMLFESELKPSQAELGRWFGKTKARIGQIVKRGNDGKLV